MKPAAGLALISLAAVLCLLALPRRGVTQEAEAPAAAEAWSATLEAAREALGASQTAAEHGVARHSDVAVWSRRVLEAEQAAGGEAVAAHQAHLERVQRLLQDAEKRKAVGNAAEADLIFARYEVAWARATLAEVEED